MKQMKQSSIIDTLLILKDEGAVKVSGGCTVGGEIQILDLGEGTIKADAVIDISAMEIEGCTYRIGIHICDDKSFTNAKRVASFEVGSGSSMGLGKFILPFENRGMDQETCRYVRLFVTISKGAPTTGINFTAYATKR